MSDEESVVDIESDYEDLEIIQEANEDAELVNEDNEPVAAIEGENVEEHNRENQDDNQSNNETKQVIKPKRVIRKPRPKLNIDALRGPRGLPLLQKLSEKIKFKGSGHEEEDLNLLMKTYEYWCHRLFPKYPFDECIEKIEKLGSKRAVKTHLTKLRLDMLYEDQPDNTNDNEENNRNDISQENELDDLFDNLINQTPSTCQQQPHVQHGVDLEPVSLTEEQIKKIQLNQERARKIREEKLKRLQSSSCSQLESGSQVLTKNYNKFESLLNNKDDLMNSENTKRTSSYRDDQEEFIEEINAANKSKSTVITDQFIQETENENNILDVVNVNIVKKTVGSCSPTNGQDDRDDQEEFIEETNSTNKSKSTDITDQFIDETENENNILDEVNVNIIKKTVGSCSLTNEQHDRDGQEEFIEEMKSVNKNTSISIADQFIDETENENNILDVVNVSTIKKTVCSGSLSKEQDEERMEIDEGDLNIDENVTDILEKQRDSSEVNQNKNKERTQDCISIAVNKNTFTESLMSKDIDLMDENNLQYENKVGLPKGILEKIGNYQENKQISKEQDNQSIQNRKEQENSITITARGNRLISETLQQSEDMGNELFSNEEDIDTILDNIEAETNV